MRQPASRSAMRVAGMPATSSSGCGERCRAVRAISRYTQLTSARLTSAITIYEAKLPSAVMVARLKPGSRTQGCRTPTDTQITVNADLKTPVHS